MDISLRSKSNPLVGEVIVQGFRALGALESAASTVIGRRMAIMAGKIKSHIANKS